MFNAKMNDFIEHVLILFGYMPVQVHYSGGNSD